ncbi:MAG: IS3 family transposase, partial [Bifidobacterium pseudocatenulatum]
SGCSGTSADSEHLYSITHTAAATVGGPDGWISWTVTAWRNHERIKRSLGWMSPVQYRQSQGMTA